MEDKKEEITQDNVTYEKEIKPSRLTDAYALISQVGSSITRKKVNAAKGITMFIMIAGLIVFNFLWKNHFLMLLTFVVGLIFLVAEFALESFYLGNDMTNTKSKQDREDKGKKPKPKDDDGGWLGSLGIPSASDYSKQAEEGMFGSTNNSSKQSKSGKKGKKKQDDEFDMGLSSIKPVKYEDIFQVA